MSDIYDRAKATAARMLAPRSSGGKGLALTLRSVTQGEYDPDVGTSSEVVVEHAGSGFRQNYELKDIDGSLVKSGDVLFLVSPVLLDGTDTPTPSTQDKVVFDGATYNVVDVKPWNYAGLAVGFEVQARK